MRPFPLYKDHIDLYIHIYVGDTLLLVRSIFIFVFIIIFPYPPEPPPPCSLLFLIPCKLRVVPPIRTYPFPLWGAPRSGTTDVALLSLGQIHPLCVTWTEWCVWVRQNGVAVFVVFPNGVTGFDVSCSVCDARIALNVSMCVDVRASYACACISCYLLESSLSPNRHGAATTPVNMPSRICKAWLKGSALTHSHPHPSTRWRLTWSARCVDPSQLKPSSLLSHRNNLLG